MELSSRRDDVSDSERDDGGDPQPRGHAPDASLAATFRKIDHFTERLGAIRQQLAERRHNQLRPCDTRQRNDDSETVNVTSVGQVLAPAHPSEPYEPIVLPRLPNAVAPTRVTEPRFDGHLMSMDAMRARAVAKSQHDSALEELQRAEEDAAGSVQEADRLTEEARIAMVLYTKNERSWNFDERARRYQEVMQAKKEAEGARLKADDDRIRVQCMRTRVVDPYRSLRSRNSQRQANHLIPLASSNQETAGVWILASPLLTLPFTPREATPGSVLAGEKELSTHVVYYVAASAMSITSRENGHGDDDKPPLDGWLSCSSHGVMPPPSVTPVKSSIETWLVSGAGATHLNGKYLFSGIHEGTRKFKSTAGVELFRKELPKTSSIIRGVFDLGLGPEEDVHVEVSTVLSDKPSHQLPSTLRALESNEEDFKAMEKIGAWMSSDTILQKRRRMRDSIDDQRVARRDGDYVLTQETSSQRMDHHDLVLSHPVASAALCREWVLFLRCSRRADQLLSNAPQHDIGLGCLKRHYYISVDEKETMTTWVQEQEAWLEKDVLKAIIRREQHIQRVSHLCQKCMNKFQQDLREETHHAVNKILGELNKIRFLTVKVLEAIEAWRSHARRRGYTRYDGEVGSSKATKLGWSASITVGTGRKLYKGSHAFVSKFKRYCRPEDPRGRDERRLVYLGYFSTRDEAEQAYDEFANAEARRLNTTVEHLPRRRSVFRSCGKHFSVESERLGPDYCIECAGKQLSTEGAAMAKKASSDEWNPPFFFPAGQNYILKLANDLDFLDNIAPLKNRLNKDRSLVPDDHHSDTFPLLGNVFLLPRTPIEDPNLAFFASLKGSGSIPALRNHDNQTGDVEILEEALDYDRVLNAQQIFVTEMQIYYPELFRRSSAADDPDHPQEALKPVGKLVADDPANAHRIVQALYWDRCAALRIRQRRAPLPFRQPNVWCRPDAGEWASLLVRGKHQQHVLFENRLAKAGKETQERRKKTLKLIRKLLKTPLYFISSRQVIQSVIAEGEHVRGDVVLLEVKSAYKYLEKYDAWRSGALHVQRWFRGVQGRRRARATQRALHLASGARLRYMNTVSKVSAMFYTQYVIPSAVRSATKKLRRPAYSRTVRIDGELLVVNIHAASSPTDHRARQAYHMSVICASCARRFRVAASFTAKANTFCVLQRVCCCALAGPVRSLSESWMIRAYNPSSNVIYRLMIQSGLLTQLLRPTQAVPHGCRSREPLRRESSPLGLCRRLLRSVEHATNLGNYIDVLASRALEDWMNWRILSDDATQRRKIAEIDLEKARERVIEVALRLDVAVGAARRALDFTSRPFAEAQAWDALENANDWRQLVRKRHTQKELAMAIDDANQRRFELFQATANENFLRVESSQRRIQYEAYWKPQAERQQEIVNTLTIDLEMNQAIAVRAMSRLCLTQLAVRDTYFAPARRALVIAPAIWHRTDSAMQRMLMIALPGLQRGRNTLRRQAMYLSDLGKDGNRRCARLIVDVSAWTTRPKRSVGEARNIWMTAYDPVSAHSQRVYLDWELVQLLATPTIVRQTNTSERDRWLKIAQKLLSLCMLDRFTGEFTLRKLQFYHRLRLLRPHFLASRWFQDLKRGRKCGDGDEIFRQSITLDGRLCFVVVYENWGDLNVHVYRSSAATTRKLRIPITLVFALLASKPLALHLWVCCVKSNQYSAAIISAVLKFVRISDENDSLYVATQDRRDTSTCAQGVLCIATIIDQRRVLLRFRDQAGGDLDVRAYDLALNKTFRLQLEWETIRRVLKTSQDVDSGVSTTRRRNLTLSRNRHQLCNWIASRLSFQSLLEHPDVLASSISPFVGGVQVRRSFLLLNEWIATSIRNPLREVSQGDIDRFAAVADSALFDGLAHEQLALIPQKRLPYSYDKHLVETRDFIFKGVAAASPRLSLKHLKIDLYLRTHRLYARVRQEIHEETIARHEREENRLMENEEGLTFRQEILILCETARKDLLRCRQTLQLAKIAIGDRLSKADTLFNELTTHVAEMNAANGKKRPGARRKAHTKVRDTDVIDSQAVVSNLLTSLANQSEDPVHAILGRQRFGLIGLLPGLLHQIEQVQTYVDTVMTPKVEELYSNAKETVLQGSSVDLLQATRQSLHSELDFKLAYIDDGEENPSCEDCDETTIASTRNENDAESDKTAMLVPTSAFILHANGATDEVMVESSLVSATSFMDTTIAVSQELMPMFKRPPSHQKQAITIPLCVKRVPLGILVFDKSLAAETSKPSCPWNTRATALAAEPVVGTAVFIPRTDTLSGSAFMNIDLLFDSLTVYEANDLQKKPRPSSGSLAVARRRTVQRSKQLLPWKQLSVERMQTTRRLRQQRMRLGLRFGIVDDDQEREQGTLAVYSTTLKHLEWIAGGDGVLSSTTTATLVESLRLRRGLDWVLTLENTNQLKELFDTTQRSELVPAELRTSELRFEHIRVQVDDWERPRRLIFSCQELQSRQQYFVDCSRTELLQLIVDEAGTESNSNWSALAVPAAQWRAFAIAAAKKLTFRRKNGVVGLHFLEPIRSRRAELDALECAGSSSRIESLTVLEDETHAVCALSVVVPGAVQELSPIRAYDLDVKRAMRMCRSRRFMKQQMAIRRAAVARQLEVSRSYMVDRRLALEWLQMTQEDWNSHEHRGILTLDEKELNKLKQAFGRVHQRRGASGDRRQNTPTHLGRWLMDVDKEMGAKDQEKRSESDEIARYVREATQFLSAMERTKWWPEKHTKADPVVLDIADVAEWWRQHHGGSKSDRIKPKLG